MRTNRLTTCFAFAVFSIAACGGGQGEKTEPIKDQNADNSNLNPGDGDGDDDGAASATDAGMAGDGDGDTTDGGVAAGDGDGDVKPDGPAVTIKIKNTWTKPLEFNLTLGWGSRIQMYSGKPPKAVAIEPFARACTASCSAEGKARCPVCKKPTSLGQIRKQQRENTITVEPGSEYVVTWDGKTHTYQKTKASGRGCSCFEQAEPPAETYTVRVCGLRLSKKHRKKSKLQCVTKEDLLTLPVDGPQVFDFEFGDPSAKPAKKPKKK